METVTMLRVRKSMPLRCQVLPQGVSCDEFLQRLSERGRLVERALHVVVAEHGAACGQALLQLGIVGQFHGFSNAVDAAS
jgi:hypothetical protein